METIVFNNHSLELDDIQFATLRQMALGAVIQVHTYKSGFIHVLNPDTYDSIYHINLINNKFDFSDKSAFTTAIRNLLKMDLVDGRFLGIFSCSTQESVKDLSCFSLRDNFRKVFLKSIPLADIISPDVAIEAMKMLPSEGIFTIYHDVKEKERLAKAEARRAVVQQKRDAAHKALQERHDAIRERHERDLAAAIKEIKEVTDSILRRDLQESCDMYQMELVAISKASENTVASEPEPDPNANAKAIFFFLGLD